MKKKPVTGLLLSISIFLFLFILNSCIGISADIQMRRDGSGRITLEYRFSRMAETIGRLDGNERRHIIPVGRADFERTVMRIDGLRLVSFSGRENAHEIINTVTLEFSHTEALMLFFGSGTGAHRSTSGEKFNIILSEPFSQEINPDLMNLMQQVSAGYKISISFSAPGNSTLSFTDGAGRGISPPGNINVVSSGRRVSMEIDTIELLRLNQGLGVEINR